MIVQSDLGALPVRPSRSQLPGPPLVMAQSPLLDGPRILFGPFNFKATGSGSRVVLEKNYVARNVKAQQMVQWVYARIVDMIRTIPAGMDCTRRTMSVSNPFAIGPGSDINPFSPCMSKDHVRWLTLPPGLHPLPFFNGTFPIASTFNDKTKSDWVLYSKWDDDGITIEFKPRPPGILTRLWGAITSVISTIVDTVVKLFEFLKNIGCALARSHIDDLQKLAAKEAVLSEAMTNRFTKLGVTVSQLQKIETGATSAVVGAVANQVANAICGPAPVKKYPPGAVTAYDPKIKKWRVAGPKGSSITGAGLKAAGDASKGYVELTQEASKPSSPLVLTLAQYNKLLTPWYKRTMFYVAAGGGLAIAGGGAWYFMRRRG